MYEAQLFASGMLILAFFALLIIGDLLFKYIIPAKWVDKLCNTIGWEVRWEDEPLTVRRRHKNYIPYIRKMLQVWAQRHPYINKKRRPLRSDM